MLAHGLFMVVWKVWENRCSDTLLSTFCVTEVSNDGDSWGTESRLDRMENWWELYGTNHHATRQISQRQVWAASWQLPSTWGNPASFSSELMACNTVVPVVLLWVWYCNDSNVSLGVCMNWIQLPNLWMSPFVECYRSDAIQNLMKDASLSHPQAVTGVFAFQARVISGTVKSEASHVSMSFWILNQFVAGPWMNVSNSRNLRCDFRYFRCPWDSSTHRNNGIILSTLVSDCAICLRRCRSELQGWHITVHENGWRGRRFWHWTPQVQKECCPFLGGFCNESRVSKSWCMGWMDFWMLGHILLGMLSQTKAAKQYERLWNVMQMDLMQHLNMFESFVFFFSESEMQWTRWEGEVGLGGSRLWRNYRLRMFEPFWLGHPCHGTMKLYSIVSQYLLHSLNSLFTDNKTHRVFMSAAWPQFQFEQLPNSNRHAEHGRVQCDTATQELHTTQNPNNSIMCNINSIRMTYFFQSINRHTYNTYNFTSFDKNKADQLTDLFPTCSLPGAVYQFSLLLFPASPPDRPAPLYDVDVGRCLKPSTIPAPTLPSSNGCEKRRHVLERICWNTLLKHG